MSELELSQQRVDIMSQTIDVLMERIEKLSMFVESQADFSTQTTESVTNLNIIISEILERGTDRM